MEIKMFETLSKCKIRLDGAAQDVKELDAVAAIAGKPYSFAIMNEKLHCYKTGWTKYLIYNFEKPHRTSNKNVVVIGMLHLIHASENDIIIAKVLKRRVDTNSINIRYILMQGNKEQQCNNLKELYQCMTKSYNYEGRPLTKYDFIIKEN